VVRAAGLRALDDTPQDVQACCVTPSLWHGLNRVSGIPPGNPLRVGQTSLSGSSEEGIEAFHAVVASLH
jgi:hypothetical protein